MIVLVQFIAMLILIALGAFFSGSETGVYRISRFRLRWGIEHDRPFYKLLGKVVRDSQSLVVSILLGNNLANCAVTSLMTVLLLKIVHTPQAAQFYTTVVMTPLLFTFSEVIPKNVYYYRADKLMLRFAPVLWLFNKAFTLTGAVWALKVMSNFISSMMGSPDNAAAAISIVRRQHVRQLIHETHEEGLLSSVQNEMMSRLINIPSMRVGSVMTEISRVVMLKQNSTREELLNELKKYDFENYPVYKRTRNNIVGYVNIYDALTAHEDFRDLSAFVKPIDKLRVGMSITEALRQMQIDDTEIALVIKGGHGREKIRGVITVKDIAEEITGELI